MADLAVATPVEEPDGTVMSDDELAAHLKAHEERAVGYYNSEIADEQARAINYYYGKMDDLPALEGCSSVVDHSVAVMVDNGLAAILKPFVSADEVVSFNPRGPEDVRQAEQATDFCNYVINCDNAGFLIFHDWFKDALLTKIGVVKVRWDDRTRMEVEQAPVDDAQLLEARESDGYLAEQPTPQEGIHLVSRQVEVPDGRVVIENIPPEEFLITPFARSIEDASYVAHRPSNYTRSDLIEMGMDAEIVSTLPAYAPGQTEESRSQARYRDEEWMSGSQDVIGSDRSRDIIGVLDEYVRIDYDGDGVSELRRIIRVDSVILFNEEVKEAPFALICPVPMPHKVYGVSTADQSIQGQRIGTAIARATLDNLNRTNNPKLELPETAIGADTVDDLLDSSPGGVVRTKAPGLLNPIVIPFTANHGYDLLEYFAQNTEERTGIQRKGNGFNAEALKKNSPDTATQAAIDENSRNERAEMIARIFAETGVKRLFKLVLGLLVENQPKARMIRLRNEWVEMDPSNWSPDMDLTISVGLGVGNKQEQITQAETVLGVMERLAGTPFAHLVNSEKVINALKKLYNAVGIKNVEDFYAEPQKDEQGNIIEPEQPPDPETMKAQAELQMKQAEMQAKQQEGAAKLQLQQQEAAAKIEMERERAAAQLQLEREKAAQQAQLAQSKAQFEADLAVRKMEFEQQIAEKQMAVDAEIAAKRADQDHEAKMSKNREGGDLSK